MELNKIYKGKLLRIAIPIMLSNLISQLQMLIDRIFLGRLDISAMSAVGNVSSPMWTAMSVNFTLAVGSAILISQAIGEGDRNKAQELTNSLFKYSNYISAFMFLFWFFGAKMVFTLMGVDDSIIGMSVSYARIYSPVFLTIGLASSISTLLQVSEKTNALVVYGVVRSAINIVLDYGLIFGKLGLPRMEVSGAALATTIAELIGGMVVFYYVCTAKDLELRPSFSDVIKAKLSPYIASVKMGIPSALEDFCWNIGNLFLIVMLNRISVSAAGVYSIIFGIELIPIVVVGALGSATLTLSGQETGKKNYKGIKDIVIISLKWCFIVAGVILLCLALFPKFICSWFTTDASIIAASGLYLLIVGIDMFPKSMNIIVGSGIKGYGDTKWMLCTQFIGTVFIIASSAILVMVFHLGMTWLFCLVVADETLRCTINTYKLRKITATKAN